MRSQGQTIFDAELRAAIPAVTAALVRRYGDFADCEDAVQEALLEASVQWPHAGRPRELGAWLYTVARRRYIDGVRADTARRAREDREAGLAAPVAALEASDDDDSLALLLLCCHPALAPASRVALTLRVVCGLTTAQIARAFYAQESAMAQRLSRAKRTIDEAGRAFPAPLAHETAERLDAVRSALYLMFNEGYAPSEGELPVHGELVAEAIRLTRRLHTAAPADGETTALLTLMLLSHARTAARSGPDGLPIALPEQDRSSWDALLLAEGRALAAEALAAGTTTPLRLQAAIAAVHAAAPTAAATDWGQILALYEVLVRLDPSPAARLGRAVAVGMAHGPLAGLAELGLLEAEEPRAGDGHRLLAVRAALLAASGAHDEAARAYADAAQLARNTAERRYLTAQAQRLSIPDSHIEVDPHTEGEEE